MKRKQASTQPDRRRPLAEINLLGQKGTRPPTGARKRRGCAQVFGVLSVLGGVALWLGLTIGTR